MQALHVPATRYYDLLEAFLYLHFLIFPTTQFPCTLSFWDFQSHCSCALKFQTCSSFLSSLTQDVDSGLYYAGSAANIPFHVPLLLTLVFV